jgi:hypothetical protein
MRKFWKYSREELADQEAWLMVLRHTLQACWQP